MKQIAIPLILIALGSASFALAQKTERATIINIKVASSVKSVTYRTNGDETPIDFQGTALLPRAEGKARVENKQGITSIEAEFSKLEPATKFGPAYLTYVLWAITPEGRSSNLGEVMLDGSKAKIRVTTRLLSFGMVITAEPYFAVSFPSEMVVIENIIREDTKGKVDVIDAKYELLQRGQYDAAKLEPFTIDPKVPLELYEARNAVRIAKWQQADRYAGESWTKAQAALQNAETNQSQKGGSHKLVVMSAREAVQMAEDARIIAIKRAEEERLDNDRRLAEERQARATAEAESEARRRAEAEAKQREEEEARRTAEKQK